MEIYNMINQKIMYLLNLISLPKITVYNFISLAVASDMLLYFSSVILIKNERITKKTKALLIFAYYFLNII